MQPRAGRGSLIELEWRPETPCGKACRERGAAAVIGYLGSMAKARGRGRRKLPDMGVRPSPDPIYSPPSFSQADVTEWPVDLGEMLLVVRQTVHKGLVVDFALMLYNLDVETDTKDEICRIDCCHGTIHRHNFRRGHRDEMEPVVLESIDARPGQDPWQQVNDQFQPLYEKLLSEAEELKRRWAA